MPEFLARSFADRAPGMWVPVSVESEEAIAFANLKTELAVEIFRCGEIGDEEMETVDGVDAKLAGAAVWPDESFYGRHRILP